MAQSEHQQTDQKVNILMVDDRPENLMALEAILEPLGQNLVRAISGREALKHLLRDDFAVILLDVQMPELDGFETAALIKERERSRHIPIIFVTAISKDEGYVYQGYSAGAVDYIFKPFDPEILKSKVSVFVELFKKGEQIKRQAELLRQSEQREKERELAELERDLERRRLADLAESEARLSRFKSTLDATLDSVFIFEADSLRFSYANQGALKHLGYSYDELLTMTPWDIQSEFDEPRYREMIGPLLQGRRTSLTFQTQHRRRDGTAIPVETFLQFISSSQGTKRKKARRSEDGRFVAIVRDITERKRAEEALILAKEEAERANHAKSEFISSISHELRTPLNAIIGFSKLLLNPRVGTLNGDQQAYMQDVVQSGEHLLQLINDILDLSKVEAGKMTLEFRPFCLAELLDHSLSIIREKANAQDLTLTTVVAPEVMALPPIIADERKIKQVMYNLLSNSVKFTPDGGAITVRAWYEDGMDAGSLASDRDPATNGNSAANGSALSGSAINGNALSGSVVKGRAIISVEDTGIGISPEHQERVFGAFEQVDSSYARQQQGTGLGLALTKRMVEMHGGRIWLNSILGEGSTFSFSLPLRVSLTDDETPSEHEQRGYETRAQNLVSNHAEAAIKGN